MKKYHVNFINQNLTIKAEENSTVAEICEQAGFPLDMVCSGKGTCGKCRVEIEKDGKKEIVLACQTRVSEPINIYIEESDYSKKHQILECMKIEDKFDFDPSLKKTYVDIKELKKQQGEFIRCCDLMTLRKFSSMINEKGIKGITFVRYEDKIIDVQKNDTTEFLYGTAVDIGTTTVVMYIYNMNTGKLIKSYSDINSQSSLGADVISRIFKGSSLDGIEELSGKIIYTLNNLVDKANIELPFFADNMYNVILCGNSVMQHLFFKLRPDRLGTSPFTSITKDYVECFGEDIDLNCPDRCKIIFLPLLGGFVGADTTAVLLAAENKESFKLIVDLGTNGEIATVSKDGCLVSSTACGPALEGGNIKFGMRGTIGAVEHFEIENDVCVLKVIGDGEPEGICGSGIIDITAEMLKNNIIDNTGRMLTSSEYKELNTESSLFKNLRTIDGENCFIIYENNDKSEKKIYINQKDIRQVQLAKSAIYSGCMAVLKAIGKNVEDVEEAMVAGAFGSYINIHNALYMGLLPHGLPEIKSIGNGAGKGASMFLLDRKMRKICNNITSCTSHYELADDNYFSGEYMKNINFIRQNC
jgi:uncharacterized 2Fe-2S/4Fe-4S cluster protein (DUF4445 family)